MKKYLLLLILPFLFIRSVNADICNAVFTGSDNNNFRSYMSGSRYNICLTIDSTSCYQFDTSSSCDSSSSLCLDSSKNYTIFAVDSNNDNQNILFSSGYRTLYFLNQSITSPGGLTPSPIYSYTEFPTSSGSVFIWNVNSGTYGDGSEFNRLNSYKWYIVEGSEPCIPSSTPPEPPTPTPDTTYSFFITLYLDRIGYLANGFTSNPYLLAMLGIIFSWIVLELFLHIIHIKGGYKK